MDIFDGDAAAAAVAVVAASSSLNDGDDNNAAVADDDNDDDRDDDDDDDDDFKYKVATKSDTFWRWIEQKCRVAYPPDLFLASDCDAAFFITRTQGDCTKAMEDVAVDVDCALYRKVSTVTNYLTLCAFSSNEQNV